MVKPPPVSRAASLQKIPAQATRQNLCGKSLSSSMVIFCRTGKTPSAAKKVKVMDHSGCRKDLLSGEVQVPAAGVAAVLCWVKSTQSCKKVHFDLPSTIASSRRLGKSSRTKLAYSDNSLIDSSTVLQCREFTGQRWYLHKRPWRSFFPYKYGLKLFKQRKLPATAVPQGEEHHI